MALLLAAFVVAVATAAPSSLECEVNVATAGTMRASTGAAGAQSKSRTAFCVKDHAEPWAKKLCQSEAERGAVAVAVAVAGPNKFCVQEDAGLGQTNPCPHHATSPPPAPQQALTLLHGSQQAFSVFPYRMYPGGCYPLSATSMNRTMRTATLDPSAPTSARWRALMHPDGQRNVTILVLGGSVAAAVGMKGGGHAARWARWLSWMSDGRRTFRVVNHAHSGTNVFWVVNNLHEVLKDTEPGTKTRSYKAVRSMHTYKRRRNTAVPYFHHHKPNTARPSPLLRTST